MAEKSIKDYLSEIGKRGGKSKSDAKIKAITENAKRPRPGARIPDDQLTPAQRKRRERDAARKEREQQNEK